MYEIFSFNIYWNQYKLFLLTDGSIDETDEEDVPVVNSNDGEDNVNYSRDTNRELISHNFDKWLVYLVIHNVEWI